MHEWIHNKIFHSNKKSCNPRNDLKQCVLYKCVRRAKGEKRSHLMARDRNDLILMATVKVFDYIAYSSRQTNCKKKKCMLPSLPPPKRNGSKTVSLSCTELNGHSCHFNYIFVKSLWKTHFFVSFIFFRRTENQAAVTWPKRNKTKESKKKKIQPPIKSEREKTASDS